MKISFSNKKILFSKLCYNLPTSKVWTPTRSTKPMDALACEAGHQPFDAHAGPFDAHASYLLFDTHAGYLLFDAHAGYQLSEATQATKHLSDALSLTRGQLQTIWSPSDDHQPMDAHAGHQPFDAHADH